MCYFNVFANPSFFKILSEGVLKVKNVFAYYFITLVRARYPPHVVFQLILQASHQSQTKHTRAPAQALHLTIREAS